MRNIASVYTVLGAKESPWRAQIRFGILFAITALVPSHPGPVPRQRLASPSTKGKRGVVDVEYFAGMCPGLWTRKDPQTS